MSKDNSNDKVYWDQGNIAEWYIWLEAFNNICIQQRVPFITVTYK